MWRNELTLKVCGAEGGHYLEPIVAGREDELSRNIRVRLDLPSPSLRDHLKGNTALYFQQNDLLLTPGHSCPAHDHIPDGFHQIAIAGETVGSRTIVRTTAPWNLIGSPALVKPFGQGSVGLPIGIQITGRHFDEATVFRGAKALESKTDVGSLRPPV